MAEVIGLVASVVQLAGAGLKLSQALYQYADGVATADRRIKNIAKEVQLTSLVIQELGDIFKNDETANLLSENAVRTANETIKECSTVFKDIQVIVDKTKPGRMGRLMLPFRDNKIELLRSQMDKLKSTLELLMQVLMHAQLVSSNKLNREAEAKQREEIKQLLENKKQSTKKYEESLRNFSISDSSTAVDDEERWLQDEDDSVSSSDLFKAASAIGSTIDPETLSTCVDHVQSLLADIQILQLALSHRATGGDHSDYHQKAIGSYFLARSHLDSVLLGSSRANITGIQTQQPIKGSNIKSSASDPQRIVASDATSGKPPGKYTSTASSAEEVEAKLEHERKVAVANERAKIIDEKSRQKSGGMHFEAEERKARLLAEWELYRKREAQKGQEWERRGPIGTETVRQESSPIPVSAQRFLPDQTAPWQMHYSRCTPSTTGSESYKRPPPPVVSISQLRPDYIRPPQGSGSYIIEERRPGSSGGPPLLLGSSSEYESSSYSSNPGARPFDSGEMSVSASALIEPKREPKSKRASAPPQEQRQKLNSRAKERSGTDAGKKERTTDEERTMDEERERMRKREEKKKTPSRKFSFGLTAKQKQDQKDQRRAEKELMPPQQQRSTKRLSAPAKSLNLLSRGDEVDEVDELLREWTTLLG